MKAYILVKKNGLKFRKRIETYKGTKQLPIFWKKIDAKRFQHNEMYPKLERAMLDYEIIEINI